MNKRDSCAHLDAWMSSSALRLSASGMDRCHGREHNCHGADDLHFRNTHNRILLRLSLDCSGLIERSTYDICYGPIVMTKQASSFELRLAERCAGISAYRWLYAALRIEIVEGRLRPGARLPATRELAKHYVLSRGTVVNGFEQLK